MPTVRSEGCRQHVVANHMEGVFAIVLMITGSGVLHVGVGRLAPMVEALGEQDENASDDRRPVPSSDLPSETFRADHGYRRITAMLRSEGWTVNAKRVERIWRREGLKVPQKQPKKGRLWLNDGSCVRLRPEHPNHVWSYDFVEGRTRNGRKFRMLNIIDEFTRECLAIRIGRKLNSTDVIDVLPDLFILRGVPGHVRSDNGPEFIAKAVREWVVAIGAKTAFIEPGSPWENGYCESFNSKLRDELLNGEIFYSLAEAKIIIEAWRRYYNTERPHSSLGYKPPAPEAMVWPVPPRGSAPPSVQAMAEKPIMH